jgi:hypothetical protein
MNTRVGRSVKASFLFVDEDGDATDPTTIMLRYRKPQGGWREYTYGTDAEVNRVSAGIYYVTMSIDSPGTWRVGARSTGAVITNSPDYTFEAAPAFG